MGQHKLTLLVYFNKNCNILQKIFDRIGDNQYNDIEHKTMNFW